MTITATTLGYAFLGGFLPPLIWLYILLKEDSKNPEPRTLIALSFIMGIIAVPIALPLEQYAQAHLVNNLSVYTAWALVEELLKYIMAAAFILWRHSVDEAPDYVVYMITVALGFAAAENVLFLTGSFSDGLATGFFTGDIRFLGATLLHVVASAAIGFAFAFSYAARLGSKGRIAAAAGGLILAVALHTAFNMIIISGGTSIAPIAFFLVWMVVVIFFATFEVLKYFQYRT